MAHKISPTRWVLGLGALHTSLQASLLAALQTLWGLTETASDMALTPGNGSTEPTRPKASRQEGKERTREVLVDLLGRQKIEAGTTKATEGHARGMGRGGSYPGIR